VGRGGTYEFFEGIAFVTLLLKREGREAATFRRLLSVEPSLGSTPEATFEGPKKSRAGRGEPSRERPVQERDNVSVFWS